MTSGFIEYLYQFFPIALGAGIMLSLRSMRGRRRRIRIETADARFYNQPNELPECHGVHGIESFLELSFSIKAKAALKADVIELLGHVEKPNRWRGYLSAEDDMPRSFFRRIVEDRMIIEGITERAKSAAEMENRALFELGMVDLPRIDSLLPKFMRYKKGRLTVLVREKSDLIGRIVVAGKGSGMLLGYLLDMNLDVIGVGNELDY